MRTKDEHARALAEIHYSGELGLLQVFRVKGADEDEDRPSEPVKLLEVNTHTVPSGILPLRFGPSPTAGLDHPSIIMEVSPDEFRQIQSDHLKLPHGWTIGEPIPRPSENGTV